MNKKISALLGGLFILATINLFAQNSPGGGPGSGPPGGGSRGAQNAGAAFDTVATAVPEEKNIYTTVAGRLRPALTVSHPSPVAGTVSAVHVRLGQEVVKNEPLFTVVRDESAGSFAPVVVRSRIDGIVSSVSARLYNEIRSAEVGLEVIDPSLLMLRTYLSDKDAPSVRVGMKVEAVNSRGMRISGRLVSLSPEPDYQTGLFYLDFEFRDPSSMGGNSSAPNWLGQFVRVDLPVETVRGIFVSQNLLVRRYGQYYLWTVTEEKTLRLQRIQTGITIDETVLIQTGLQEGDNYLRVITGRETEGMPVPGSRTE
ncbi:MAG: HlyD family efflux transporter periplasmic adaptor subunit [Spirochaetales bacterium]|nr:HlyD family efflux transporter periplasmic adaptor subunit [Spirochaetales bacterium]